MTLGQRIKNARLEKGLTQRQLVGDQITRNMLSKIENDSATPSVRTLEYLAGQLGMPVSYFIADSIFSDGSSPDGLDDMRRAYKEGRFTDCLDLLEKNSEAASTDEGYLLRARSALGAAHAALLEGNVEAAKEYADSADYYNKEGMYYSAAIDAEMSLILAECALKLDITEFEYNAKEYERAVRLISFADRFKLDKSEYLIRTGNVPAAAELLDEVRPMDRIMEARLYYLQGMCLIAGERYSEAVEHLKRAEEIHEQDETVQPNPDLDRALEQCYMEMNNFRMAYYYAAKQLGEK